MSDAPGDIVIPDRPSFKAQEVCDLLKLQPYVLRSWENEFGDLGVARAPGAPRVYRRADVELAIRIRHLVFNDGLTLAGVRRRLEAERPKAAEDAEPLPAPLPAAGPPPASAAGPAPALAAAPSPVARVAIEEAKRALRGVLELLEERPAARPPATGRPKVASRARIEDGAQAAAGDLFAPTAASAPEAPQVPAPSAPPPPPARRRSK